jgi:hypothetical protein
MSVTTTQPTVEVVLTCAYCQLVGHEFKNCPFVDDKLKKLMKNEPQTFFITCGTEHTSNTCWCTCITNPNTIEFGY